MNIEKIEDSRTSIIVCYIVVLVGSGVLFSATCAPGVLWQDSGVIQYRASQNDIEGKLGLALSHPLYYLIILPARYIPFGEYAYRVNIANAIISAFAIANLYLLLRLWLGDTFAAWLGAATLALSHTFWQYAAMPETYNLAVALMLLEIIMLLQYAKSSKVRYLFMLAFFNGLAISNHNLALLSLACYLVLIFVLLIDSRITFLVLPFMALFWIIGALPYEYLIVKNIVQSNEGFREAFAAAFSSAFFGENWKDSVLNTTITPAMIKENLIFLLMNFPSPNILLTLIGAVFLYRISPKKWFAHIILAMLVIYFGFAFRYNVADRYTFFIPSYCIISILIAVGAYNYLIKSRGTAGYAFVIFLFFTIPAYMVAPYIAEGLEIRVGGSRELPYRDNNEYYLHPWKIGYRGAEHFAVDALSTVHTPALVYSDATAAGALLYMQEERHLRSGQNIKIVSSIGTSEDSPEFTADTVEQLFNRYTLYVVSPTENYCPDFIMKKYRFEPAGVLWRVVNR